MKANVAWACDAPPFVNTKEIPCYDIQLFKVGLHCALCPHSVNSTDLTVTGDLGDTQPIYPITDEDVAQDAK